MIERLLALRNYFETLAQVRRDGWENCLTGVGTSYDKACAITFNASRRLTDEELRALFHYHATSYKIVSIRPRQAFREGFSVKVKDEAEQSKQINDALEKLGLNTLFRDGTIWGRLYGGCLLVMFADDGKDMSEPLEDDSEIRTIHSFTLVEKQYLYPLSYYEDPQHPKYLQVETYGVMTPTGNILESAIHETRTIRFGGAMTDATERRRWNGWDHSVLQRVYDILAANENNFKSVDNLLSDMSQAVFKIKGLLASLLTPNGEQTMRTRMSLLETSRSVARAVLLDAEHGEEFHREATPVTGVTDLLDQSKSRTSSAAEIPEIILWGSQSGGLNNNAEGEYRHFYDDIRAEQKQEITPLIRRVVNIICRSADGPTGGNLPEAYEICFPRLWQPSPSEAATIAKTYAERDQIRILGQVWNASEVALAIAKNPDDPDRPVEIDTELHETMLENEKEMALNGPQEIDPVTGQPLASAKTPATSQNGGNGGAKAAKESSKVATAGNPRKPG